jgi:hypothetical protein
MQKLTHITNSERNAAACGQLWFLKYGLGLRPQTVARTLSAGRLWHETLDLYFRGINGSVQLMSPVWDAHRNDTVGLTNARAHLQSVYDAATTVVESHQFDPAAPPRDQAEELSVWALVSNAFERYVEHWSVENKQWDYILHEQTMRAPARTNMGNESNRTGIAGQVDRVIRDAHGRYYIVEHKFSGVNLEQYRDTYARTPQAMTYAWLVWRTHGIQVSGVIYDLALRKTQGGPDSLETLKDGSRLAKVNLPDVSADAFVERVEQVHGMSFALAAQQKGCEWYPETLDRIRENAGRWFYRHLRLISEADLLRIEQELYGHATSIRRWADRTTNVSEALRNGHVTPDEAIAAHTAEFPRNPGMCMSFGRLCDMYHACQYGEAGPHLRVAKVRHEELDKEAE